MSSYSPAGYESDEDCDDFDFGHEIDFTKGKNEENEPKVAVKSEEKVKSNCILKEENGASLVLLSDFQNAVISGNSKCVSDFLRRSPSLCNTLLNSTWPPITYASKFGNLEIIKILVEAGCDVNLTGPDGCTALMAACKLHANHKNTLAVINCLFENGAKGDFVDRNGKTALMFATKNGNIDGIHLILQVNNPNVNRKDNKGWSALDWALANGFKDCAKVLIKAGAYVFSESEHMDCMPAEVKEILTDRNPCQLNKSESQTDNLKNLGMGDSKDEPIVSQPQPGILNSDLTVSHIATRNSDEDILILKANSDEEEYQRYGQLELFLCGLELSHLIPKFHEHDVRFEQLLSVTDKDLSVIGISQFGARNRILTALKDWHSQEWQDESLPNFNSTVLTFGNLQAVLRTSSEHLLYISSALRYSTKHLEMHPAILQTPASLQLEANPDALIVSQVEKLLLSTHKLCSSLKILHQQATLLKKKSDDYTQVDFIETRKSKTCTVRVLCIALPFLASFSVLLYKAKPPFYLFK
ncbi:unnamed protein product [Clavelina lepadiformis]|uniref:Ankyrin repeat, SAM and basic leucine zipper domain-containing protein 1 n=1 Tax=Clavelina lepadiformis TaxID=159417 RepID=A0ABP0F9P7_CLALP